ncbi:PhzF family phenazine biosynthesis protein [Paenibacillus agricola]|uniref:PhzF family phenazine biosynthesis protein n=1 Tax=Paenibacillus agricola TaxID=2716264 RepID=A0ABX0JFC1_9BACL|nr:PhzF family phenazine biosynthesis protein [Paenibacillus agricola]NHN34233.1 PhzF family phenazine biosynthesis protein [Paenibacillus agricola]
MISIYTVDTFTSTAFSGNPAAVCILEAFPEDDHWLQQIAAEMNLSETAFLCAMDNGSYRLRWFTPVAEVDLCGHATLASAQVLWESGAAYGVDLLRFHTKSGVLTAKRLDNGIELNFPAEPPVPCDAPPQLAQALGNSQPVAVCRNRLDYIVELASEKEVRELKPDFRALAELPSRGLLVTGPSEHPDYDFVARCFFSPVGVDEDPVTGSAYCALAPYWKDKLGKSTLSAIQLSARGGAVKLQAANNRVLIQGQAVIVIKGLLVQ